MQHIGAQAVPWGQETFLTCWHVDVDLHVFVHVMWWVYVGAYTVRLHAASVLNVPLSALMSGLHTVCHKSLMMLLSVYAADATMLICVPPASMMLALM